MASISFQNPFSSRSSHTQSYCRTTHFGPVRFAFRVGAKDPGFTHPRFLRSNPRIVTCILPRGKYIVTKTWRLLRAQARPSLNVNPSLLFMRYVTDSNLQNSPPMQEHAALQGFSSYDFSKYKLATLPARDLQEMAAGAALVRCKRVSTQDFPSTVRYIVRIYVFVSQHPSRHS